ncbi:Crp/Fnr family transcriptional regulator [Chitinophaga niabensis]|uniref:Crp/Fnr family transcriptional regulator n=1 Tax=Chitinophaga niabensis TaxID=536979 RepID=UPI0031BBC83D
MPEHPSIIHNILQLVDLTEQEIEFITSRLVFTRLRKKEFLLREGEVCKYKNYIVKGCLVMYYIDEEGRERVIHLADRDHWANDLYSYFTGKPASFFFQALEDAEVLQLSRPDLDAIFTNIPKMERFFRIRYQNSLVIQQHRIIQNQFETAEQKYQEFRQKYQDLEQRIPLKYIASYLGITQQFLSVLRANF